MTDQLHEVSATLRWRRFPDGAVVYDSRHGRTHLVSTAAVDVLEVLRFPVEDVSIGEVATRVAGDDGDDSFLPDLAASAVASHEQVEDIVAELLRLGLISSRATKSPALANEGAAADTSS